jgi:hypothetical protein
VERDDDQPRVAPELAGRGDRYMTKKDRATRVRLRAGADVRAAIERYYAPVDAHAFWLDVIDQELRRASDRDDGTPSRVDRASRRTAGRRASPRGRRGAAL